MLKDILIISLSSSIIILLLLAISPVLSRRYSAKWRYFVWLMLAVRLIIPYRAEFARAPINIPVTEQVVVLRDEGSVFQVMTPGEAAQGGMFNENPADYAPIADVEDILNTVWIAGIIIFMAYHIGCYLIFKKSIKPYLTKINDNIYKCDKTESPMMIGFFKPTILLPDKGYTDEEIQFIVKHEMTHFKRGDLWYKLVILTANAVHWFNPLVYLMVRQASKDLEYFCDDVVTKDADAEYKKQYSMTILKTMIKRGEFDEKN